MKPATRKKTAKELVQERCPTAFVEDDGESVRICTKRTVKSNCPNCQQPWERQVTDHMGVLGRGGNETYAWEDAARSLGLLAKRAS